MAERMWIFVAGILVVVAAIFVWWNNFSAAFVSAALGACAWFLSYRSQLRGKHPGQTNSDSGDDD
jgi:F0F1-type ATP synthase assembly protein I